MEKFATTYAQVADNAKRLNSMASGATEQRKFFKERVANALYHVVIPSSDGWIFSPIKWAAGPRSTIETYSLDKGPNTQKFRAAITRMGFHQISPGQNLHDDFYIAFVEYCSAHGFNHSAPDLIKRHYHVWPDDNLVLDDDASGFPDEISDPDQYWEGAKKTVSVNRFERDGHARTDCIKHHGVNCSVCSINFADLYGDHGAGFIHVHHIVPLSTIDARYQVDPIRDLIPVCPNCHAMLHRKCSGTRRYLSIDELRKTIVEAKKQRVARP